MRAALDRGAGGAAAGEVPVGAVVLEPAGAVIAAAHNERECRRRPDRARRGRRAAPGGCGAGLVAPRRLHARRDAGAVHDVRRRARPGPGVAAGLRRVGPEGRRGRVAVGRRPRPAAQPPARGGRPACCADECGSLIADFFDRQQALNGAPVRSSGGGVSERPKEHASKACVVNSHRGFESHRHRPVMSRDIGDR